MSFFNRTNPICLRFIPYREKISAALFYLTVWSYLFCVTWTGTTLNFVNKPLNRQFAAFMWTIVYIAIVNILLLEDYSIKDLLLIIAVCAAFYFSYKHRGTKHMFLSFALVLSGKHADWKRFLGLTTFVYLGIILLVMLALRQGYLITLNLTRGDRLRTDMGFSHPNAYAGYLMTLCIYWMMWRFEKLNVLDYILVAAVMVYCWVFPNSRTATYTLLIMLIAMVIFQFAGKWMLEHLFFKIIFLLAYPIGFAVSLYFSFTYNAEKTIYRILNTLLSGRIALANIFMEKYSLTPWGQKIKTISSAEASLYGKASAILDNAYVRIVLENGWIPALLFLIMIIAAMFTAIKYRRREVVLALCLFAVYGLFENRLTKVAFNCSLFALPLIFQRTPLPIKEEKRRGRYRDDYDDDEGDYYDDSQGGRGSMPRKRYGRDSR